MFREEVLPSSFEKKARNKQKTKKERKTLWYCKLNRDSNPYEPLKYCTGLLLTSESNTD